LFINRREPKYFERYISTLIEKEKWLDAVKGELQKKTLKKKKKKNKKKKKKHSKGANRIAKKYMKKKK